MNAKTVILSFVLAYVLSGCRTGMEYSNPLRPSTPDPSFVHLSSGISFLSSAQTFLESHNGVEWEKVDFILDSIAKLEGRECVMWCSSLKEIDGRIVCHYGMVPWERSDSSVIAVAYTDSTTRDFHNLGYIMDGDGVTPLCGNDPFMFADADGSKWLVLTSGRDGVKGIRLSDDGLSVPPGEQKFPLAPPGFYAGGIFARGGYYYLFASFGTCCEEEDSKGYLTVARSENVKGPYVDRNGDPISNYYCEHFIQPDDRFVGLVHCTDVFTDDNGEQWIYYNAWDKTHTENMRCLMLDKVKWSDDGWPVINDGYPSSHKQHGPYFESRINTILTKQKQKQQ